MWSGANWCMCVAVARRRDGDASWVARTCADMPEFRLPVPPSPCLCRCLAKAISIGLFRQSKWRRRGQLVGAPRACDPGLLCNLGLSVVPYGRRHALPPAYGKSIVAARADIHEACAVGGAPTARRARGRRAGSGRHCRLGSLGRIVPTGIA